MSDSEIFIVILIGLGSLVLSVLFMRWAFGMSAIKAHARAQTILLAKIAVKSGVPKEEVEGTLNALEREL